MYGWERRRLGIVARRRHEATKSANKSSPSSDVAICSEDATFFDPHTTYGMASALEPAALLRRIPFGEVMRLALFGNDERISAAKALSIGLVSEVVGRWPRFLDGWARLGQLARDPVEGYACARVGYHRGLDRLRQSGWRGSGYVRSSHPENRGFLAALEGLRRTAAAIGERDEADRCAEFLVQLDPHPEGSGNSTLPG